MTHNAESAAWYVVDHDRGDAKVRGPFDHAETASAVRREIERRMEADDDTNLWVVIEPAQIDGLDAHTPEDQ